MRILADLHTHTLVSNHAYNTLTEMARQANALGMFAMAVTDHGSALPDSPHPWYFYNLIHMPHRIENIWLLRGAEANVLDHLGTLDFSLQELERLQFDWLIASIHGDALTEKLTFDTTTELWLNVAKNPAVDMIGHSESPRYPYDYDTVVKAFALNGKVVELNANSASVRPGGEENMRLLALACKKYNVQVAVNSDAHSIYHLGNYESILPMLESIDFPPELVINSSKERLIAALKLHGKQIANMMEEV